MTAALEVNKMNTNRVVILTLLGIFFLSSCAERKTVKLEQPVMQELPSYIQVIDERPKKKVEPLESDRYVYSDKDLGVGLVAVLRDKLASTLPSSGKDTLLKIKRIELSTLPIEKGSEDIEGKNYVSQYELFDFSGVITLHRALKESFERYGNKAVSIRCIVEYEINSTSHRELEYGESFGDNITRDVEAVLGKTFNSLAAKL